MEDKMIGTSISNQKAAAKPKVILDKEPEMLKLSKEDAKKRIAILNDKANTGNAVRNMSDEDYKAFLDFKASREKKDNGSKELSDMTVADLKKYAADNEIALNGAKTKADILFAISNTGGESADGTEQKSSTKEGNTTPSPRD